MSTNVLFLLGSANISGGTNIIFNHSLALMKQGFCVDIAVMSQGSVTPWHKAFDYVRFITLEEARAKCYDLCIATYCMSVYEMCHIKAGQYMYFVQSIEGLFRFDRHFTLSAQMTYMAGLPFVSVAPWITDYLIQNGSEGYTVLNGIDKELFNLDKQPLEPSREGVRILVEGQLNRFSKNVNNTLKLVRRSKAKENVWLVTLSNSLNMRGVNRVFSAVHQGDMASIYRSCDVLVKLSYVEGMSGPPLEMMHCGGIAIVNKVPGSEIYMQHGKNGFVVDDEKDVIKYINELCENPSLLNELKKNALQTAEKWPSNEQAGEDFVQKVRLILEKPSFDIRYLERLSNWLHYNWRINNVYNTYNMELAVLNVGFLFPGVRRWVKRRWLRGVRLSLKLPDPFCKRQHLTLWEKFSLMSIYSILKRIIIKIKGVINGNNT